MAFGSVVGQGVDLALEILSHFSPQSAQRYTEGSHDHTWGLRPGKDRRLFTPLIARLFSVNLCALCGEKSDLDKVFTTENTEWHREKSMIIHGGLRPGKDRRLFTPLIASAVLGEPLCPLW